MKKYCVFLLALTALFNSCNLLEDPLIKGKHTYSGGTTTVKVGSWSTETVGNGKIDVDIEAGIFTITAGSANTKTELFIFFSKGFTNNVPELYSFSNMDALAWGDYWRETSTNFYYYSHDWKNGQYGSVQITTLTDDLIEGEYEFKGSDTLEDYKERTIKGSFSIPKQ